ncbi:MAG: hypothetical protein FWH41_05860, partial [Treponema sp.]|nr:hypothetical protein [Treponema sp.]
MLDKEFKNIIRKIADEKGKSIFLEANTIRPLLLDYTRNEFKKESSLLVKMIDAGCAGYINNAENLEECKQFLIKLLEEEECLSPSKCSEMLDLIISIFGFYRFIKKGAEQGNAWAQNSLGDCYFYGKGVTQDYRKAVEWYTK